ncbi:sensor domain-containing diguanylate cyclase [Vibrio neptunius]|uniref:Sensor domain-containing diguanylate cyclase n=1 Tax=Vibrio neptunius TaxID=170651 RepID=A0ABS3A9P0_9VIBR|nr:sensor domain-containing diguanylate cyclase [Vibrio neptunius]MBN3494846.1 sensor domain-containing diguanylate cyclase [Vibrio neptunius]MBN3517212.1 sensor domain-containing diguanylate cyclase [Vibrio neptunius]MBN3551601.1 sensor domain-containing diguanylate cyclase [Vibrio neptunius]MBN3579667.1 sensor domain-containing diguanylate cyclase [Vibrio neptunius]MCH9873332.1 sensor domain-containing diguanylate cyclase [Vibrio neptunius]
MKEPDFPNDEEQRIKDLHSLDILDTQPEERFDRITRVAQHLFDVPIAVVSLVDVQRQWFKSCIGLPVRETARNVSFCGHAINGEEPFIINDATKDPRFLDNPLVIGEPHIRFYAGIPLVYHNKSKLGTLCIIDTKPRELTMQQMADLVDLAKMAEQELESTIQATLDPLTQISNRRGFFELTEKSMQYCRMGGFCVALAYFDLNDFKAINDELGHKVGDAVLQQFADLMATSFSDSDVFARIGGDEFVVFMSGLTEKVATVAIERFRKSVERFNQEEDRGYEITFSVGIAVAKPSQEVSIDTLLEMADEKMYQEKCAKK